MTRQDVFSLLDGERAYQEQRWPDDGTSSQKESPANFHLYMQTYLDEARATLSHNADFTYTRFMDTIRKVTALGVAAMEKYGAPARV